jgi:phosphatidylserine synthase
MRIVADILTAVRLLFAAFIVYAGLQYGAEAFEAVAAVFLLGWTLDTLDGHLARADTKRSASWLGSHEREVDAVMVVAGFVYLTLIGVVPAWLSIGYLVLAILLLIRFRSKAVLTLLEAPLVLLMVVTAFVLAPLWGWVYVAWGLGALILDRRRVKVRVAILWDDAQRLRDRFFGGNAEGAEEL